MTRVEEIKILAADYHALVPKGRQRMPDQKQDVKVAAEAGDGKEAVILAERFKPDIAVIDISLPKLDRLFALCIATTVLIFATCVDGRSIFSPPEP